MSATSLSILLQLNLQGQSQQIDCLICQWMFLTKICSTVHAAMALVGEWRDFGGLEFGKTSSVDVVSGMENYEVHLSEFPACLTQ